MITSKSPKTEFSLLKLIAQASEFTSDEIIITDNEQNIIYVNPAFTHITGFSHSEVIGKKPSILKSGKHSQRFYNKMWNTLNNGDVFKKIMVNRHKNGLILYEEKVIVPIKNIDGVVTHYVSTGRDVTQRIELQKQLKRNTVNLTKANKNLDIFVYQASHDIRGPLATIIGITNIFTHEIKDKKALRYCNYVKSCAQNLDEILKSMLHMRILNGRTLDLVPTNFTKLFDRMLNSFKNYDGFKEANINISIDVKTSFYSDESMLFSILQNLAHNAVKFRKNGHVADIHIKIKDYKNGIKIEVTDNGIGIKKHHLPKILTMFYKGNHTHKGSGLGLYFVDQMVAKLCGKISITSIEHLETRVIISLPSLNA